MNLPEGLHPVFGESNECIPGLDICEPLEIQASSYSQKLEKGTYSQTAEKQRKVEDFQILNLLKDTLPTQIRNAYDDKRKEPVVLLQYKRISVKDVSDLIRETAILRSLHNKHLLEFYGTVYGKTVETIYLSFEPFECFLSQLLCEKYQQLFETPVVKCVMLQLFNGLAYLHEKEIVHRDLSTKNLVITEKGLLKISNFRSALRIDQCAGESLSIEYCYQPVDVLMKSETISTSIDIWSATCIFGEMILKRKLFESRLPIGVIKKIFTLIGLPDEEKWPEFIELPEYKTFDLKIGSKFNSFCKYIKDKTCLELLKMGFIYNPKYRISAKECLRSRYFIEEPESCSIKSFGMKLHGKEFEFPVTYCLDIR